MRESARLRGPTTPARRAALACFVVAVLLLVIGLPLVSPVSQALRRGSQIEEASQIAGSPQHQNLTMNLTDQPGFYSPRFVTLNVSTNLTLHLDNRGAYSHTFTLSKLADPVLNSSWTPAQLDSFINTNGTLANVTLSPGAQGTVNITFGPTTASSSFEFLSVVPYQFQAGMWGLFNVTGGPGVRLNDSATNSLSFVPSTLQVNASKYPVSVNVLVTNAGTFSHTWTLMPQSNVTVTGQNYSGYLTVHPALVSASLPGSAGGTVWANFSIPRPGVYQFICTVSGHLLAGMQGFLYVGVPPPLPPPALSAAIVQIGVLVGVGVLFTAGVVLVALVSLSGRFPKDPISKEHD